MRPAWQQSAPSSLPAAYGKWRDSDLGRITDGLESNLILELLGSLHGQRILDVGCGDGVLAVELARRGGNVTGLDADPGMLAAAQERSGLARVSATFIAGDARSLPFDDSAFDIVVAITVLCFVPDAQTAFQEFARVLRPGGRLVVGELGRRSLWAAKRRISGWLGSATWRVATFRTPGELRRLTLDSGLDVIAVRGAIFYPPFGVCARRVAPVDPWLGRRVTTGAAFLAVSAIKPDQRQPRTSS